MNGLARLAAQAQAASAKKSVPEDLQQPRRTSAVLSQTAHRGSSRRSSRRRPVHGRAALESVHHQHESSLAERPWDAQRNGDERREPPLLDNVHHQRPARPRPRPIPLPPPSSSSRFAAASFQVGAAGDAGKTTTTGGDTFPTFKSMAAPLSGSLELETVSTGTIDRSLSAKRRKVDHHATPDHLSLLSSNVTRASIITNKSPRGTQPFFPVKVKNEPTSPPLLPSAERQTFPDRELKFQGRNYVVRGDDISVEWPSLAFPFDGSIPASTPSIFQSRESTSQPLAILASHHKPTPHLAYNNPIIPPSPAPTTTSSASPKPPATFSPLASPSPQTPSKSQQKSNKPKTEHIPRGDLDLATAIRLSQRDNASPRPPPFRGQSSPSLSSSSSGRNSTDSLVSAATALAKRLSSASSPSLSRLAAYDTPTRVPPTVPSSGLARGTHVVEDEVEVVEVGSRGGREEEEEEKEEEEEERMDGSPAALDVGALDVGEASGWTVIQDVAGPDRNNEVDEGVEEEHEQLVEDEEDQLMEAADAAKMGTKDESGDELNEVEENSAVLDGPHPTMTEKVLPEVLVPASNELMADTVWHDLSRDFLTKYMMVYEADRARLISAYAPDAKLIYRISEPLPTGAKTSQFPLRSAHGHDQISTFLRGLGWTHSTQKLDKDGDKEVDVEFWSERLDQCIWLYVRSVMTTKDAQEPSVLDLANQSRRSVDHCFLLQRGTSENAVEDAWPLIVHVHQLVMHESTL